MQDKLIAELDEKLKNLLDRGRKEGLSAKIDIKQVLNELMSDDLRNFLTSLTPSKLQQYANKHDGVHTVVTLMDIIEVAKDTKQEIH